MSFYNFTTPGYQNLNYSMGSPGGFSGCHLKFIDKGVFRCNKAYIKLISINNERMTLKEDGHAQDLIIQVLYQKIFVLEE